MISVITTSGIDDHDNTRDLADEMLRAIRDVKVDSSGAKYEVPANEVVNIRLKSGLSQSQYAATLTIHLFVDMKSQAPHS